MEDFLPKLYVELRFLAHSQQGTYERHTVGCRRWFLRILSEDKTYPQKKINGQEAQKKQAERKFHGFLCNYVAI